jgi:hypothetical protein
MPTMSGVDALGLPPGYIGVSIAGVAFPGLGKLGNLDSLVM